MSSQRVPMPYPCGTLDPDCFVTSVEWLVDPSIENRDAPPTRSARVWSYSTPWVTYQVTHNGQGLVARAGTGEWGRRMGSHHRAICDHFGLRSEGQWA